MRVLAALAVLLLAEPAFAAGPLPAPADAPMLAPALPAESDWSGPYAGVELGYGEARGIGSDGEAGYAGAHLGYRRDFGRVVVGVEGAFSPGEIETGAGELSDIARLSLKTGVDFGRTLVYGSTGFARAEGRVAGQAESDTGIALGIGLDRMIGERLSLGGEIVHHDFEDFGGSGEDASATTIGARLTLQF